QPKGELRVKSHVWRPLFVVIGLVVLILLFRTLYVPDDFGTYERGYMFGFHRLSNEQEWKDFPAKYKDSAYCSECHDDRSAELAASGHEMIPCENCHGAAFGHPENPEKLAIDRSRELCIRCHAQLFTPSSGRSAIPGIDPSAHNAGVECSECHNPHNPSLEEM
ncbi:MAG TPA: cytochrome c3 family protein, partial [Desulfuromonadales bacterium]|nr:cytochrome c3 family protein [Desulfuromonadales bacterium]